MSSKKRADLAKGTPVDALCEEMNAMTLDCKYATARAAQIARLIRLVGWTSEAARARLRGSLANMTIRLGGADHKRFTQYQRNQLNAAVDAVKPTKTDIKILSERRVLLQPLDTASPDENHTGTSG